MFSPDTAGGGFLMLALILAAFAAMTRYHVSQALAMPLLACAFLGLQGTHAEELARIGLSHFADIAIVFTAVAIPAHMIDRSQGFQWIACYLGGRVGVYTLRYPRISLPAMTAVVLAVTFVLAALMHNVTSILIMTPVIIRLCANYRVPSRWILSGALVSSNLGGFSTSWGDTPNIVESMTWGLTNVDFAREILPPNLIVLSVLIGTVLVLTNTGMGPRSVGAMADPYQRHFDLAAKAVDYQRELVAMEIDTRLLFQGVFSLAGFLVLQAIWPELHVTFGALTILAAVLLDRQEDRLHTLKPLGFDVYLVFAAIFILAGCVEASWIGAILQGFVKASAGSPLVISLTGYVGTSLTEAASWATTASSTIHPLASSHTAAWALGAGICAGSSSIVTAASAGIILCEESRRMKDEAHVMTFARYLGFGLPFSLFMLIFYSVYFTFFQH